jgi:uncharacterized membrane protein YphA (DoxX/SURF4 family)
MATIESSTGARSTTVLDPIKTGRGLAAIRIFFGLILFANGIAKVFEFRRVAVGEWWITFLIDKSFAQSILDSLANKDRPGARLLPGLRWVANEMILDNWEWFQWVLTGTELGVGSLLILGLASRGAALVGFGFQFFLALYYLPTNKWSFEQPHEYIPLLVLALFPAGRVWGLDGWLLRRRPALRRWPF